MLNTTEVVNRMEPTGALLVLTAATVHTSFKDECEARLLYDTSLLPPRLVGNIRCEQRAC
jgi:hypothetical protein